jgi:hypothetical protein
MLQTFNVEMLETMKKYTVYKYLTIISNSTHAFFAWSIDLVISH